MGFLVHGSEVLVVGVALLGFWVANSVLSSGRKPRERGGEDGVRTSTVTENTFEISRS